MILLIKLVIAHLAGDFIFQPDSWVKDKEEKQGKSIKLYYHILVHISLTSILLWDYNLIPTAVFIGITHYIIDLCKLSIQHQKYIRTTFIIDQFFHFIVLLLVVNHYEPISSMIEMKDMHDELYLLTLAIITLIPVSSKTIKLLISKWTPKTEDNAEDSLKDAGQFIGILERLFVFGFVLSGQIQAVGFLLAAKSVFRFGDLRDPKDRKLTEYILIGTLVSFGIALLIGYTYLALRNNIIQ